MPKMPKEFFLVTWQWLQQSESLRDAAAASTDRDLSRHWGLSVGPALPRWVGEVPLYQSKMDGSFDCDCGELEPPDH